MITYHKRVFNCCQCDRQLKYPIIKNNVYDVICYYCWIDTNTIDFEVKENELFHLDDLSFHVTRIYSEKNKEAWR